VFDEVKPLLFFEGGLEIGRAPEQAGFTFFADAAFEDGLYEHAAVALDQRLDLVFACIGGSTSELGKETNLRSLEP
jgi:hypothetical protein